MKKIFKNLGLSAGIAFAFLFATSMIVAQEKVPSALSVALPTPSAVASGKSIDNNTIDAKTLKSNLGEESKTQQAWFKLKEGVPANRLNALDASNYELHGASEPCSIGSSYCGVYTNDVGGMPDLSSVSSDIEDFFDGINQSSNISAQP